MQMSAESMRACADRCAEEATIATNPIARKRYARLSLGWNSVADNQDWLDGRMSAEEVDGLPEDKSLDAVVRHCPL